MNSENQTSETPRLSRREAIRWVAMAGGSVALFGGRPLSLWAKDSATTAKPYGRDPVLTDTYDPGAFWPLTLNAAQRKTLIAVCDLMIPADDDSPSASKVGVPDFVDEWISAPYKSQASQRQTVLDGLAWFDAESQKRFHLDFAHASASQQSAIADDVCSPGKTKSEFAPAAHSFSVLRSLIMGGYYTTPAGMKSLGFIGNVALSEFPDPPREVLEKLGLT